ncbi:MAG TPA: hypothetical protein VN428_04190 [Bryobacteraceae bacterium]|nr:hypothetical protein [Bryobacteraceae bacterium]
MTHPLHSPGRRFPTGRGTCLVAMVVPLVTAVNASCPIDPERPETIQLQACRPTPISPAEKAIVLAALPTEGEVMNLGKSDIEKLDAVRHVLRFHDRDKVYDLKVVDVPQAWTGLYRRGVLLISLPALKMLTSGELVAIVAHEVGHEYVWEALEAARAERDEARLRSLELACDAIAAITLTRIGVPPDRLTSALDRVFTYNHRHFGISRNHASYPDLNERRAVVARAARVSGVEQNRGRP